MAINLATEYSTRLDERFKKKSLTDQWCGHNYDWTGSNAISVWTLEDPEINDYSPEIDTDLKVICFPTFKGHCGCILFKTDDINLRGKGCCEVKSMLSEEENNGKA